MFKIYIFKLKQHLLTIFTAICYSDRFMRIEFLLHIINCMDSFRYGKLTNERLALGQVNIIRDIISYVNLAVYSVGVFVSLQCLVL